jgi:hypothetical protein
VQFLNPPEWNGEPFVVDDLFTLTKGTRTAHCTLQSHPLGMELRLFAGSELLQSQVCRNQDDVLTTSERWKAAMQEKGWL